MTDAEIFWNAGDFPPWPAPPPPPLPPFRRRLATFLRALLRHALAGFPRTPAAKLAARRAACLACDRLRPDGACGGAGGCGCVVELKASWDGESCPLGRWPDAPRLTPPPPP